MGIYYIVVNDTKRECIDPLCFQESLKRSGVLKGLHGLAVSELLMYREGRDANCADPKYSVGYWAGDRLRVVGDSFEEEYRAIKADYRDISYHVMARLFETSSADTRQKIGNLAKNNQHVRNALWVVNNAGSYKQLDYALQNL